MERFAVMAWLVTWGGLTVLLLAFLLAVNAVSEYRRLAARGFPRPLFLIARRVRGTLVGARGTTRGSLVGRTAWLSWDIRWLTSGETLAVIVEQSPSEALDLELELPVEVAGQRDLRAVRFVPRHAHRAAYDRCSVRGRLFSSLQDGVVATADVVVYPPAPGLG